MKKLNFQAKIELIINMYKISVQKEDIFLGLKNFRIYWKKVFACLSAPIVFHALL